MPEITGNSVADRPDTSGEERSRLLLIAERLLELHGPDKLSIRELAREGAISTMGIYTLFGGRTGVMQALYVEGFARLHQHAAAAEDPDHPLTWLTDELHAYRRFALNNVGMYRLMFGGEKRFKPTDRDQHFHSLVVPVVGAYPVYAILVAAIAAYQNTQNSAKRPADELAHFAWGVIHGLVSLEIAGYVDSSLGDERFKMGIECILELIQSERTDKSLQ